MIRHRSALAAILAAALRHPATEAGAAVSHTPAPTNAPLEMATRDARAAVDAVQRIAEAQIERLKGELAMAEAALASRDQLRAHVTQRLEDGAITLDLRGGVIVGAKINGEEVLVEPARVALDERTRQSIETAAAAINHLGEHLRPRPAPVLADPAARSAARSLEAAYRAARDAGRAFGTTTVITSDLGRALGRLERLERLVEPPTDNARDTASS